MVLTRSAVMIFVLLASFLWARTPIVTDIVDGNTVLVDHFTIVQLQGVDAIGPSGEDPKSRELHNRSAAFVAQALEGKKVRLEYDPANELKRRRHDWGRAEAYVYLEDGTLFNLAIIEQGYARASTKSPVELAQRFQAAERRARADGIGLWALERPGPAPAAPPQAQSPPHQIPLETPFLSQLRRPASEWILSLFSKDSP